MFLFYVLGSFKKGDTIQGGTLSKEIRYSVRAKLLFWFRSDTKTEPQNSAYSSSYAPIAWGYFFHHKRAIKPNLHFMLFWQTSHLVFLAKRFQERSSKLLIFSGLNILKHPLKLYSYGVLEMLWPKCVLKLRTQLRASSGALLLPLPLLVRKIINECEY